MQRESEGNLPQLSDKEGIIVEMRDADSMSSWSFKYKLSLLSLPIVINCVIDPFSLSIVINFK